MHCITFVRNSCFEINFQTREQKKIEAVEKTFEKIEKVNARVRDVNQRTKSAKAKNHFN